MNPNFFFALFCNFLDGANYLDNEIFQLENDLLEEIPPARIGKAGVTRDGTN